MLKRSQDTCDPTGSVDEQRTARAAAIALHRGFDVLDVQQRVAVARRVAHKERAAKAESEQFRDREQRTTTRTELTSLDGACANAAVLRANSKHGNQNSERTGERHRQDKSVSPNTGCET